MNKLQEKLEDIENEMKAPKGRPPFQIDDELKKAAKEADEAITQEKLDKGNCPYCDETGWGGSQEMFENYKSWHENRHPKLIKD